MTKEGYVIRKRKQKNGKQRTWVWPLLFCLCAIAGFSEGCPLNMHLPELGKSMITTAASR